MNKQELIAATAAITGQTKRATEETINALIEVVQVASAAGEEVRIPGLFYTKVVQKEARTVNVPGTDRKKEVPAKNVVKIKPAKELNDAANGVK